MRPFFSQICLEVGKRVGLIGLSALLTVTVGVSTLYITYDHALLPLLLLLYIVCLKRTLKKVEHIKIKHLS